MRFTESEIERQRIANERHELEQAKQEWDNYESEAINLLREIADHLERGAVLTSGNYWSQREHLIARIRATLARSEG